MDFDWLIPEEEFDGICRGDGVKTRESVIAEIKGESLIFSLLSRVNIQRIIVSLHSWRKEFVCLFVLNI